MTVVAFTAFLPFLRGALRGSSLYFRDLSLHFLPLRRFALEGLAAGQMRLWNPFVHEGIPSSLPAFGYPLDLLQLLRPDEAGISLVLALHLPLAAVLFLVTARALSLSRTAAVGGALIYALGGFLLSTVNLYVYAEAAAWAPLLVLGLVRFGTSGDRRWLALTAGALALGISTTGVEIIGQAALVGLVLGVPQRPFVRSRLPGMFASLILGAAIAAPIIAVLASQLPGSARGQGFDLSVVLSHSVHPFTLVQVLVAGLYGDPGNLVNTWWGSNFFPRGFPYVLSLYLGGAALALAVVGAGSRERFARRLTGLALVAVLVSLGRWSGLWWVVEAIPPLHAFRFPVKAFFLVHFAVSLLATLGLGALEKDETRRLWRRLAIVAGALGAPLVLALVLPRLIPDVLSVFSSRFFPPDLPPSSHSGLLWRVLRDAAVGGTSTLLLAAVALAAARRRLGSGRASLWALVVACADLLRAGAGLNPMVPITFLRPSPQLAAQIPRLREGRVFTCSIEDSRSYRAARAAKPGRHELWTFAVAIETLTPFSNIPLAIVSALSQDNTMLVPQSRLPSKRDAACSDLEETVPRLRAAGVQMVLSLDPLEHPALVPSATLAPRRIAPLVVRLYRLESAAALVELDGGAPGAGRILSTGWHGDMLQMDVETAMPLRLVVREGRAFGWSARVDGVAAPIELVAPHYMGVRLAPGRHTVRLRYRAPWLTAALALSAFAVAATLGLLRTGRPRSRPAAPAF